MKKNTRDSIGHLIFFIFFAAQIQLGTFFISAEKGQDCVKKSSLGSLRKLLQTFSLFSNPGFSSDTETCVTICSLQSLPFPPSPEPKSIQPGIISRGYFFSLLGGQRKTFGYLFHLFAGLFFRPLIAHEKLFPLRSTTTESSEKNELLIN